MREAMSVKTISSETLAGRDFYLSLGDFLDEFYKANQSVRETMLCEQPDFSMPKINLAYLSASVHKLANDNGIIPPDWIFDDRCYMHEAPFFGCNAKGDLRLLFMYKSPPEFKHRNLFVDENVLKRI
jgi:hypothetical protein